MTGNAPLLRTTNTLGVENTPDTSLCSATLTDVGHAGTNSPWTIKASGLAPFLRSSMGFSTKPRLRNLPSGTQKASIVPNARWILASPRCYFVWIGQIGRIASNRIIPSIRFYAVSFPALTPLSSGSLGMWTLTRYFALTVMFRLLSATLSLRALNAKAATWSILTYGILKPVIYGRQSFNLGPES